MTSFATFGTLIFAIAYFLSSGAMFVAMYKWPGRIPPDDNAVGIVTGEIGVDAAPRHRLRFLAQGAGGHQQGRTDLVEPLSAHSRHRPAPCESAGEALALMSFDLP